LSKSLKPIAATHQLPKVERGSKQEENRE